MPLYSFPIKPPLLQATEAQPQAGQQTGPTVVAKRFENDKTFPQLLPQNLMKSKLPFCHENELNPFFFSPSTFSLNFRPATKSQSKAVLQSQLV